MEKYLDFELERYADSDYYPFHMPGHKRQDLNSSWTPESIDITEITGFDNLHHAEGILKDAQERMAELFGAKQSFFLVNGSTSGLLSAISACTHRGDRILMGRNCHKAVYHTVYLRELRAEYLYPEATAFGIQGSIDPGQVQQKLEKYPDTAAVVITSPTYDGIVSDIAAISDIVHHYGIPLIVDEAHGAHFGFSDFFPQKALHCGADLVIESLHKTLPSFTQSAVLHVGDTGRFDMEKLKRYLGIYQTSSPSYILMAGMDRCSRILKEQGTQLFADFEKRLSHFYRQCSRFQWIRVFDAKQTTPGIWAWDPSKVLISASRAGWTGQQLADYLRDEHHLEMEMVSGHYVTAITTLMDTEKGFARLYEALEELEMRAESRAFGEETFDGTSSHIENGKKSNLESRTDNNIENSIDSSIKSTDLLAPTEIYQPRQKKLEISAAMDAPWKEVFMKDVAGKISAEFVYLYPPGIPLAAPGEVLTSDVIRVVETCKSRGMDIEGLADYQAEKIRICEQ